MYVTPTLRNSDARHTGRGSKGFGAVFYPLCMGREPLSIDVAQHHVPDINDFVLADGTIVLPDGITLTSFFDQNRAAFGDLPSYRFIDYAKAQDGQVVELSWN